MITLPSPRDQRRVDAAIEASEQEGRPYKADLQLSIKGEDYRPALDGAQWGQVAIPITLEAKLGTYLPRRLRDERVNLSCEIDGVPIPQAPGEKSTTAPGQDAYTTTLISSSPGSLFAGDDAIHLNAITDYPGWSPQAVCFDTARRLPYDPSLISCQPIRGVALNWTGSEGFLPEDKTGDVLARLAEDQTVGYDYRDTVWRGLIAEVPRPHAAGRGERKTYSSATLPDWHLYRPTAPAIKYRDVRVFITDPTTGALLYETWADVPHNPATQGRQAHKGRTRHIPFQDFSANAPANARSRAAAAADEEARVVSGGEMILPAFNPLVERGDFFRVADTYRDPDGSWEVLWLMRVRSYLHAYANSASGIGAEAGLLGTKVAYEATILSEERIKKPALIVP